MSLVRDDQTIGDVLKNWALVSKAHGIANIARNQSAFLRSTWIICFLASFGYCVYQIVITVIVFLHYEVTTSYLDIPEAPALFPAVAICNLNPYDGNVASAQIDQVLQDRNLSIYNYGSVIDYLDDVTDQFKSTFNAEAENGTFNLFYNGFYLNQMFLSCKFQGVDCTTSDFTYFYDYNYGNCYRFNGGYNMSNQSVPLKKIKQAGWSNGLRLELYTGDPVYQQQYIFKSGLRVIVHNQSVIPFPEEDGIDVSTGQQTNIAVSRTFIERLPPPYNDCIEELDEETSTRNKILAALKDEYKLETYTQKFCMKACYQEYIIEECGCYDFSSPYTNETSAKYRGCYSLEEVERLKEKQTEFYNSAAIDDCYKKCPIECKTVEYDLKITFAKYPSYWYANKLVNNNIIKNLYYTQSATVDGFDSTLLMINVYYADMMYTKIDQEPTMSSDLLIAYIGGNLGLFLGVSLMTLVEAIEIIFYLAYLFAKKARKTQRIIMVQPAP